jgi:hypothetical protein
MRWNDRPRRERARLLTRAVLAVGLIAAAAIWVTAPAETASPAGYDVTRTKAYRHQMEVYGGKANLELDAFRRWFGSLWHGRALAGTVAVISLLKIAGIRIVLGGDDEA